MFVANHCLLSKNTQVDASSNSMGTAAAKAFGEMLQTNTTLTQLNVSGNSFGKMQVGDSVKLNSSGETCTLSSIFDDDVYTVEKGGYKSFKHAEYHWENGVPVFAAGIAASQSLLSVSALHLGSAV